jgi:predicted DNA-binding antitoxin AbrB/MazE fold protein
MNMPEWKDVKERDECQRLMAMQIEYDVERAFECGSLKYTRKLRLKNGGEKITIEIRFSSPVEELKRLLAKR